MGLCHSRQVGPVEVEPRGRRWRRPGFAVKTVVAFANADADANANANARWMALKSHSARKSAISAGIVTEYKQPSKRRAPKDRRRSVTYAEREQNYAEKDVYLPRDLALERSRSATAHLGQLHLEKHEIEKNVAQLQTAITLSAGANVELRSRITYQLRSAEQRKDEVSQRLTLP